MVVEGQTQQYLEVARASDAGDGGIVSWLVACRCLSNLVVSPMWKRRQHSQRSFAAATKSC